MGAPQLSETAAEVITFLKTGSLPLDTKRAKLLALSQSQYLLEDDVLHHEVTDGSLRVIPPEDAKRSCSNKPMAVVLVVT